jgi:hypothetical protein
MNRTDELYTRVYTSKRAIRSHLLEPGESPSNGRAAVCGRTPGLGYVWMGTGTQAEHDKARNLEPCRHCLALTPAGAWTNAG